MARATLKLKRPINELDVDLDENKLDVLGYAKVVRCKYCSMKRTCQHVQYLGDYGYCSHGEWNGKGKENDSYR